MLQQIWSISLRLSYRLWDGHQAFEEYRRFQPCYLSKLGVLTWRIISSTNHNFDSEARWKIQNFWDQPCTKNWRTIVWVLLQPWVLKSSINKRNVPITIFLGIYFEELSLDREDWRTSLKSKLVCPKGMADLKVSKDHVLISWDFYCRPPKGALARCIIIQEAENKWLKVREHTRNFGGRTCLYSRLQWRECF